MTTRRGTILTAAALALAVAGCAGSADPGAQDTPTPPATGPSTSTAPEDQPDAEPDSAPTPAPAVATVRPGAPDGVTGEDVAAVAGDDPRELQVVTFGSSTCPVVPTDVTWDAGADVLRITLSGTDEYTRPCTMDLVPTTSVVELPDDAPDASGLTVDLRTGTTVVP
ncbi:conserved hypothetical protein [Cellulomonas flavigena DSM 20109]|uniref:Lipoprotein n=1 Tax=Cellulomonas flavigena (strain ATCC 482 / DSM 20109 / BCRC 11376 / JCM 18109 / NBRC 3775 / NCIMB 8073 / NRS 134) TaxID=446466 RepID=D5UIE3_CELFN|nr:hypothetical protein [Cellulomonas flavigena]ADG73442.1 conserved hypothetical protein [Cellulomonas flavigena DSM 20109]